MDLQLLLELRSICSGSAYKYIIDKIEHELIDEVEKQMEEAPEISGSLHGEWKALRKVIRRLRSIAVEYEESLDTTLEHNPMLAGMIATGRVSGISVE